MTKEGKSMDGFLSTELLLLVIFTMSIGAMFLFITQKKEDVPYKGLAEKTVDLNEKFQKINEDNLKNIDLILKELVGLSDRVSDNDTEIQKLQDHLMRMRESHQNIKIELPKITTPIPVRIYKKKTPNDYDKLLKESAKKIKGLSK